MGVLKVSQKILAQNQNFKKLRHGFVDEKAMIRTTLKSSCHWRTLVPFSLQKKKLEIAFSNNELSQNLTIKQFMGSKTTLNWLFDDIWS